MKKDLRSKSPSAGKEAKPDLEGFMIKIQEQLSNLEKKMDDWMRQGTGRSFETGSQTKPAQPVLPPQRPSEVKQVQSRRERVLHKAVCADCHKDCEIPFKPSGERPVYCKACFSKRKSGGPAKPRADHGQGAGPHKGVGTPVEPNRQVIVTKKGVGKVTVSEIVRPVSRDVPKKENVPGQRKNRRDAKGGRRR